jgi:hypothetical protein
MSVSSPQPRASLDAAPPASAGVDRAMRVAVLGVGVYSCAMGARDVRYFLAQGADDAAYYLRVAEHAALGHGFTFDGLSPTNGFHPLWEWLLTGLYRLAPVGPETMLRIVWVLQSLLMTASAWLSWRLLRRSVGSWPAALGAVLFMGRLYYTGRGGMESALLLLLVLLFLDLAMRWQPQQGMAHSAAMGALAGVIMLARLDTVFVAGALAAAWSLAGGGARRRGAMASVVFATAALVVLPYLASNLRDFGHLVPISGTLKSSFPHAGWYVAAFSIQGQDALVLLFTTVLCVLFLLTRLAPAAEPEPLLVTALLPALVLGVLVHELYSAMFVKWGVFSWHFVLVRLALALVLPVLLARFAARDARRAPALWAAGTALVALASLAPVVKRDWRTDYTQSWTVQAYEAARWVQQHTPPDAVFAMKDAGNFGWFSRRHVVNLDGIVNTFAYQDSLRAGRFEGFLRSRGVGYFVQHAIYDRPDITDGTYSAWRFESYSHLYDRGGGSLTLRREDEVYRSKPYPDAGHRCVFLIWKMPSR